VSRQQTNSSQLRVEQENYAGNHRSATGNIVTAGETAADHRRRVSQGSFAVGQLQSQTSVSESLDDDR
jgi:hypothetical protein